LVLASSLNKESLGENDMQEIATPHDTLKDHRGCD